MKSGLREPCCTETAWTNFYLCVHEVTGCSSRGASPGACLWLCQLHTAHQFFWAGLVVTPQVRAGLEILSKHEVWAKCLGFGKHRWVFLWHTPRRLTAVNTHLFPITTGTREFWALPRQLRLDSWMEKLNWTTSLKGTYLEANNPGFPQACWHHDWTVFEDRLAPCHTRGNCCLYTTWAATTSEPWLHLKFVKDGSRWWKLSRAREQKLTAELFLLQFQPCFLLLRVQGSTDTWGALEHIPLTVPLLPNQAAFRHNLITAQDPLPSEKHWMLLQLLAEGQLQRPSSN